MRAALLSHAYTDPAAREKLHALAGLGCTVAALVPERWTPPHAARPVATAFGDEGGVQIVPVPTRGSGDSVRWDARAVRRFLTEFRPDLLQIEEEPWSPAAAMGVRVARRLRVPAVLLTLDGLQRSLSIGERLRRRRVLGAVRGAIAGNRMAAATLARVRPELPSLVLPQAVVHPPAILPAVERPGLTMGFVGRLVPERGLDLLFRAAIKVHGTWSITVVGTGPSQEELEALAQRLGIAARVTWRGALPRAELSAVWDTLDCIVLPARTTPHWVETAAPLVVEAMAHGVTAVVSDSGALPEIVGETGFIVPEENVAALADVLQMLLDSPAVLAERGADARRRVIARHTPDAVAHQTREFWRRVAATA